MSKRPAEDEQEASKLVPPSKEPKTERRSQDTAIGGEARPSPRLYVGNLHPNVTEANVIQLFSPYGKIVREQFFWHTQGPRKGEPRGFCFVEYTTTEEAAAAIRALNDKMLKGRGLRVRYMAEREAEPANPFEILARAKARASSGGPSRPYGAGRGHGGPGGRVEQPQPPRGGYRSGGVSSGGRGGLAAAMDPEEASSRDLESKIRVLKARIQSIKGDSEDK